MHQATPEGIVRRFVTQIAERVQLAHALVVGGLGVNFADTHDLMACDADGILKAVDVPVLKQRHVQAYMRGVEPFIYTDPFKKARELFDVVHKQGGLEVGNFVFFEQLFNVLVTVKQDPSYFGVGKRTVDAKVLQRAG